MAVRYLKSCLLSLVAMLVGAASEPDLLTQIQARGELRVVSRNGPTTYYEDKSAPSGFEYELARRFADELGVSLHIEARHEIADILDAVRHRRADLAAAGLTITAPRRDEFTFSAPYLDFDIRPQVIYRADSARPKRLQDLIGQRLLVLADSAHANMLVQLRQQHPALRWQEVPAAEPLALMDRVNQGTARFAIVASNEFAASRNFYPRLRAGFALGSRQQQAWMFKTHGADASLPNRANAFFRRLRADGSLAVLQHRHFVPAGTVQVTQADLQTFTRRIKQRLPRYERHFRQVAEEFRLDWHLLAAVAYQESHWNPRARSYTGVRGMMMLTLNTAKDMKVKNRLDLLQSLRGGARYLKKLEGLLPDRIEQPDINWFTLAAYNIGRGHVEDARSLTQFAGGNPDRWLDVKKWLPRLQQSKYYRRTRHGYARGSEAVTFVQNVRQYNRILAWQDGDQHRPYAPLVIRDYVPDRLHAARLSAL